MNQSGVGGGYILGRETRYMNIFSIFLHFLAFIISIVVDQGVMLHSQHRGLKHVTTIE